MIFKNLFRRNQPKNDSPMTIVVGLGNPGDEYHQTRHNAGFRSVDFLRERFDLGGFREDRKYLAEISFGKVGGSKIVLVKPTTFMNESGKSVASILNFYKLTPASLIVVHDEADLPSGKMKTTDSSRSAGHNGVESIITALGTQDFFRIRLGIGRPEKTDGSLPVHDHVLGRLSYDEEQQLQSLFPTVEEVVRKKLS